MTDTQKLFLVGALVLAFVIPQYAVITGVIYIIITLAMGNIC